MVYASGSILSNLIVSMPFVEAEQMWFYQIKQLNFLKINSKYGMISSPGDLQGKQILKFGP